MLGRLLERNPSSNSVLGRPFLCAFTDAAGAQNGSFWQHLAAPKVLQPRRNSLGFNDRQLVEAGSETSAAHVELRRPSSLVRQASRCRYHCTTTPTPIAGIKRLHEGATTLSIQPAQCRAGRAHYHPAAPGQPLSRQPWNSGTRPSRLYARPSMPRSRAAWCR